MAGRTDLEQLVYQMSSDIRKLEAANRRALTDVERTAASAQRRYDRLGAEMGRSFGRASLAAGVAFGAIVAYSTRAASDAAETANAFQVAFGKQTDAALAFAKAYSDEVGRSLTETQSNMARTQLVLTGVGVSAEQALTMTEAIQKRSVDIGSLWNVEDAQAYQAIISGIAGEAEPLKRFGVALNEAALKQELLRLGFKGTASDAPEAAKAVARLNIILRSSISAENDAIETKGSLANQQKAARAEFEKAAVQLGQNFLPAATKVTQAAAAMLGEFNKLPDSVKLAGLGLLALVAAGGPIMAAIDGFIRLIKVANAARAAIIAAATVQAGAGVAGGAGAAVAGAGLVAGAAVAGTAAVGIAGAGVVASEATIQAARKRALADLTKATVRDLELALKAAIPARAQSGYIAQNKKIQAELARRAGAAPDAPGGVAVPAGVTGTPGAFGLSPNLLKPTGGGSGGAKAKADKARADAERAAQLALDQQERTAAAIARADDELLSARQSLAVEASARLALELEAIDRERKARADDLAFSVKDKQLTQAQADQIAIAEERVRSARADQARRSRDAQLADEALAARTSELENQIGLLRQQGDLVDTQAERRRVELDILDLQYQEQKARLEAVIASKDVSEATKARARAELAALEQGLPLAKERARRDTAGPAERFLAEYSDADKAAERFEAMAVGAFDTLADGLADAIVNAKSLGDVAKNVFRQLLADLISDGIKGSAADLLSLIPGFAGGTTFAPGGLALVGERGKELVNLPRGAQVIPHSQTLAALANRPAASAARATVVQQNYDLRGALVDRDVYADMQAIARREAAAAGRRATAEAVSLSNRAAPSRLRAYDLLGS